MASKKALTYYVSPLGRDSWKGISASVVLKNNEGPFASLSRAREAIRDTRASGYDGNIKIRVCGGDYQLSEPLVLGPEDGCSSDSSVVWEAWGGGSPRFDGGRRLGGWTRLEEKLDGLPAVARGKIWKTDIPKGWFFSRLFWDGSSLKRAVSEKTDDWRIWPVCQLGASCNTQVKVTRLPKDECTNAVLNFMATPYTSWANAMVKVTRIDREKKLIHHEGFPVHRPEKQKDIPWRLDNVISGLVEAGRWYLDSKSGVLYLWPTEDESPGAHTVTAPWLTELLRIEGSQNQPVKNVQISGLSFSHARLPDDGSAAGLSATGAAVVLNYAEDCRISNCEFVQLESNAVLGGPFLRGTSIQRCVIRDAGGGGIAIRGECGAGDFPCTKNTILDNTVEDIGKLYWHSSGITVGATEKSRIAYNHVHNVPYIGISVHGGPRHTVFRGWPRKTPLALELWKNNGKGEPTIDKVKRFIPGHNIVEKNLIHNTMKMLDDGAAIYCHAGHHSIVRHNVVFAVESPMGMGLYFDDEEMDSVMSGNLVYRVPDDDNLDSRSAVLHLHHNGRNRVANNVFIGRRQVLSIPNGYGGHVLESNIFVWTGEPNWDRAVPDPAEGPGDGRRQDGWSAGASRAHKNLWWHTAGVGAAKKLLATWQSKGYGQDSIAANPKILKTDEFELAAESPAYALGFKPLSVDDVGPRSN